MRGIFGREKNEELVLLVKSSVYLHRTMDKINRTLIEIMLTAVRWALTHHQSNFAQRKDYCLKHQLLLSSQMG